MRAATPDVVVGLDANGAELRVGDRVRHDFDATGNITGVTRATAESKLPDMIHVTWEGDPSKAPASTTSGQHLRRMAKPQPQQQPQPQPQQQPFHGE